MTAKYKILFCLFAFNVLFFASSRDALALSVSPVVSPSADDPTPLDIFLGIGLGYDSNPTRTDDATAETLLKTHLGIGYKGGSSLFKYKLGAAFSSSSYLSNSDHNFSESLVDFGTTYKTQKINLNLDYATESLNDPKDAETLSFPSFERTTNRLGFGAKYVFSSSSISLKYNQSDIALKDTALAHLDYTASGPVVSYEFGKESSQFYLNLGQNKVEYTNDSPANIRYDYNSLDTNLGWRSVTQKRTIAIGVGSQSVSGDNDAFTDTSASTYSALLDMKLSGGKSNLKFAVASKVEPSAKDLYKESMRYSVSFLRRPTGRSVWSVSVGGEQSEIIDLAGDATSLEVMNVILGYTRRLGSPQKLHGVFYTNLGIEQSADYSRSSLTVGIALGL